MLLLELRARSGQDNIDLRAGTIDQLDPPVGLPKLFCARCAGMENRELMVDLRLAEKRLRFVPRGRWYIEMQIGRRVFDSKRPQQREVILNCVQAAHTFGEIGVNPGPRLRLAVRPM